MPQNKQLNTQQRHSRGLSAVALAKAESGNLVWLLAAACATFLFIAPAIADDTAGFVPSPYASCVASCERDYTRCMEESGAARERLPGAGAMLNTGAECRSGLQACIKDCKAQGAAKPQNENPTAPK